MCMEKNLCNFKFSGESIEGLNSTVSEKLRNHKKGVPEN